MVMGAERAESLPEQHSGNNAGSDWLGTPVEDIPATPDTVGIRRSGGVRLLAVSLVVLALVWIGAAAFAIWQSQVAPTVPNIISWTGTIVGPLVLIGLVWLIFGRMSQLRADSFMQSISAMRSEAQSLQTVLEIVTARIEENHARLRGEAERLMTLGDEAADRLGRVTHYLSKESGGLDRQAAALESAAAAATFDVGVLLHDLPRAEEQARAVAEAMKEAGITAHSHASALEAQLAAVAARGREADEVLGGTAQRMAAHVAQIESGSASAAASMGEASAGMTAAVDGAMARAAEAVDAARAGLEAQAAAILATIEQSRAALDRAGDEAARNLGQRLDTIGGKIEALAGHIAAQDTASHNLVAGLSKELTDLDQWFAQLGRTGTEQSDFLISSVTEIRKNTRELVEELGGSGDRVGELIERAQRMGEALTAVAGQLNEELPAGLGRIEAQTGRVREATESLAPAIQSVQASAETAAARINETEASIGRQRDSLSQVLAMLNEGVTGAEEQLRSLGQAAMQAEDAAAKIVVDTGPELIEALLRVRETANQAAEKAREAISSVIPESMLALSEAGRKAVTEAVGDTVEQQMEELSVLARRALDTARDASGRLARQMLVLGETAAAVEQRIEEGRQEREEKESENFSRRVALLIESLNSTAIDVTKILSNEVTDSAWAAYLKGDRGVFTRRAVRLLDSGEAREIVQHYDDEPEFREQVNRYIHDFESMLRRILADKDGSLLGITILSSDMGKLYVALAQAIERLRT
ncbi:coiled-coil domain-containing protein [Sphingosinicella rhizophila]|uniref:ATPase n=1 Tax=Sphingosinicella rhizophila TaxID=3050082 RepID=A0ABU3Q287_9SPHN|nr:hypothetical protein [Sphingosinicella sp. GR2756]MDT9597494.1 hypothetical protein [Sphingosinicella sp. GR2756]